MNGVRERNSRILLVSMKSFECITLKIGLWNENVICWIWIYIVFMHTYEQWTTESNNIYITHTTSLLQKYMNKTEIKSIVNFFDISVALCGNSILIFFSVQSTFDKVVRWNFEKSIRLKIYTYHLSKFELYNYSKRHWNHFILIAFILILIHLFVWKLLKWNIFYQLIPTCNNKLEWIIVMDITLATAVCITPNWLK